MRRLWKAAMLAAAIAGTAGGAAAQQGFNGAAAIARGDYAAAERDLVAQRGLYPDDVDLMINLGTVYVKTGRLAAARRMFATAAAQPDQEMVLGEGRSASSRALAQQALQHLPMQVAAR